jgi:hypothetical protein
VGLVLDYSFRSTCVAHYEVLGWVENMSEPHIRISRSMTGEDCYNSEGINQYLYPSWTVETDAGTGYRWPLFTDTEDWFIGKDLQTSPVAFFQAPDPDYQVKDKTNLSLPFATISSWWVQGLLDDGDVEINFYIDTEWGITLYYDHKYSGTSINVYELSETNVVFSNGVYTSTPLFESDNPTFLLVIGIFIELVVIGILIRYRRQR